MVAASLIYFFVTAAFGRWVIHIGRFVMRESRAKLLAFVWRLGQAVLAVAVLYVLWWPVLGSLDEQNETRSGIIGLLAIAYTLLFGGTFVLGNLFAALTVFGNDQGAYFREMNRRL